MRRVGGDTYHSIQICAGVEELLECRITMEQGVQYQHTHGTIQHSVISNRTYATVTVPSLTTSRHPSSTACYAADTHGGKEVGRKARAMW